MIPSKKISRYDKPCIHIFIWVMNVLKEYMLDVTIEGAFGASIF
jgi:hypothetical protein